MFNAWLLLGLLVFWLTSVGGAYYKGRGAAQDEARAQYATQLEQTIAEHREDALIDMEAAREAGQREARARTRILTVTNEVEKVLYAKPAPPECRLASDTFSLLRVAVQLANGSDPDPAKPVPIPAPAVKPTR